MLKGKTAIVTGSTSGIGEAVAEKLAMEGANIVINGFGDSDKINVQVENLCKKYNIEAIYSPADMLDAKQIEEMVENCAKKFGSVDILVNNAGIQHVDLIEDFPEQKWSDIIAINLSSSFYTIKYAIKYMKEKKWGRIINIASAHGLVASAKKAAYVAAKHGIVGLTKVVALENAGNGITCNAICPGWVLTPLVQKQIDAIAKNENISNEDAKIKLLSEKQPSKQFVQPEEIGELAFNLCSDKMQQMNGSHISLDGGWTSQ